jgi:hypothetical protein
MWEAEGSKTMPAFNLSEIQALAESGDLKALTLDTSIFDQFGCNLQYKGLTALNQFVGTDVKVLLSEITIREVSAHIAIDTADAADHARSAINQYLKAWRSDEDKKAIYDSLGLGRSPRDFAAAAIDRFVTSIAADRVAFDLNVSLSDVVQRYFEATPPFSKKDKKKSEFPDAIALLSLESWAEAHGGFVLAVSRDNDWISYAETSNRIICIPKLSDALDAFNRESSVIASRFASRLRSGSYTKIREAIDDALANFIEDFEVEASSAFYFDYEISSSELIDWHIDSDERFNVVASDSESITFMFELVARAEFEADFSFSVKDGIDKDYVPMGSATVTRTNEFSTPVLITVARDQEDNPDLIEIEIERRQLSIDFDVVEPDWRDED